MVDRRISGDRKVHSKSRSDERKYFHVSIDDVSHIIFTHIFLDQQALSASEGLAAAVDCFSILAGTCVMIDSGSCHKAIA